MMHDDSSMIKRKNKTSASYSKTKNALICFASGTHIMTDRGDCMVQSLKVGDRVITRDHGMQEIRWIGSRRVAALGDMAPIVIEKGVLKNTRDLIVSPQHKMLLKGTQAELMFGQSEVLAPVVDLLGNEGVTQIIDGIVEYFHILFDRHEIIYAEGAASESYHPADYNLSEINDASRSEIFSLFPELRSTPNAYGPTARICLKANEGIVITL